MEELNDSLFRIPAFEEITHTEVRIYVVVCAYRPTVLLCVLVFIHSLTNDALSNLDHMASNCWMIVKNELERMCKEAAVAEFGYYPCICLEKGVIKTNR
jgi:hypothetical protein